MEKYDRRIAEEIFNRDSIDPTTPLSEVRYTDGRAEIYGAEEDGMDGVMVAHFSGRTVVERIFELAEKTRGLIFWPAPIPCMALTNADFRNNLPDELKDDADIAVVHSVDDLIEVIGLIFLE
jgi:hypothetical protein